MLKYKIFFGGKGNINAFSIKLHIDVLLTVQWKDGSI